MDRARESSEIETWTEALRRCDGNLIPVALKLADYYDEETGLAAPTQMRLAGELGMHQEDVSAYLRALAAQGVLDMIDIEFLPPEIVGKIGRHRGRAYRPRPDWAQAVLEAQPPRQERDDNVVDFAAWRQARRA